MAQGHHFGEQFQQLPMFMSAGSLMDLNSVDANGAHEEELDSMWDDKMRESQTPAYGREPLVNSIEREGVRSPVTIVHDYRESERSGVVPGMSHGNGHHRTASSLLLGGPDRLVPVRHIEGRYGGVGLTNEIG